MSTCDFELQRREHILDEGPPFITFLNLLNSTNKFYYYRSKIPEDLFLFKIFLDSCDCDMNSEPSARVYSLLQVLAVSALLLLIILVCSSVCSRLVYWLVIARVHRFVELRAFAFLLVQIANI